MSVAKLATRSVRNMNMSWLPPNGRSLVGKDYRGEKYSTKCGVVLMVDSEKRGPSIDIAVYTL